MVYDEYSKTDMQRASQLLKLLGDPTRLTMMKLLSHMNAVCVNLLRFLI